MSLSLKEITQLPDWILSAKPEQLHKILGGPTLLHLPGKKSQPLFISVLLHGNEPTGFLALQRLLQYYQGKLLPRAISIFFGNTQAAEVGLRHLDNQPDYILYAALLPIAIMNGGKMKFILFFSTPF